MHYTIVSSQPIVPISVIVTIYACTRYTTDLIMRLPGYTFHKVNLLMCYEKLALYTQVIHNSLGHGYEKTEDDHTITYLQLLNLLHLFRGRR